MRSLADPIPVQCPSSAGSTIIILLPTPRIKFSISCHAGLPFRLLIRQMETSAHSPDFHSHRVDPLSSQLDAVALAGMESVHILTLAFTPDPTATIALPVLQLSP